ncbi:oligosaccharide flippase family protein [Blastococcus saxobsidens]|uniref:Putative polysaccharide transport protein n=1 Tax=Blastococcus saxobsidens (strain DD2) TaxID=1146883 RepID=H6RMX5_BLASD|nr:oligosaccharide flippase family protein [Blastococcus saxobsidens]CCG01328.1 putative polysaccharide transport protein [Blastococcus saxobsidens DD2]
MSASSDSDRSAPTTTGQVARRGARTTLVAHTIVQLGSLAATVILARLLTTGEFGIVALAQSLLGLLSLLSLSGINAAIVTRTDGLRTAASSYFWLCAGTGVAAVLVMTLAARPLASLLGQPDAGPYLAVLSFSFLFGLMQLVPQALLQRSRKFTRMNAALLAGSLTYLVLEVVLAFAGLGAWAVIIGNVCGAAAGFAVSITAARWLPDTRISMGLIRRDLSFTSGLTLGMAFSYVQKNADYWLVSAGIGGPALGVYYVAYVLPNIIRLRITDVVRQVMLPTYMRAGDLRSTAQLWHKTLPVLLGLGMPVFVGISLCAEPLILLFFGASWSGAVDPLRILALGALIDLYTTSVNIVSVAQRSVRRHVLVLGFRAGATVVGATIAVAVWGDIVAVAGAVVTASLTTVCLQEILVSRHLLLGWRLVARPVATYIGLSVLMSAAVITCDVLLPSSTPTAVELVVLVLVGATSYLGGGFLVARATVRVLLRDARLVVAGR